LILHGTLKNGMQKKEKENKENGNNPNVSIVKMSNKVELI